MARARPAAGAYRHRARTAASAFRPKKAPRPESKEGRRRARRVEADTRRRDGVLPAPSNKTLGTSRKARLLGPRASWPAELRHYDTEARGDPFDRSGYGAVRDAMVDDVYRKRYNAQQAARRTAKRKATPASRVRVRAHWRRVARR